MKFFFPDSQDQIDPGFDFDTEEHPVLRVRQRDDLYAHEAIDGHVIDGLLVSKAIVDRTADGTGKYTVAQRNRLYRVGVRHFFRLDRVPGPPIETMGDCGAFSYRFEEIPPVTPDQVIDFYDACGFDLESPSTTSSSASTLALTPTRIILRPNSGVPASRSRWIWPLPSLLGAKPGRPASSH